jgi:hypothetical protein
LCRPDGGIWVFLELEEEDLMSDYRIVAAGRRELPVHLASASDAEVEDVLQRAAAFLGAEEVTVERVTSVLAGSCIICTDVVAYSSGLPLLVAQPLLY